MQLLTPRNANDRFSTSRSRCWRRRVTLAAAQREAIEALFFVNRVWVRFIEDLGSPENELEQELRANLISIGIWVLRRSREDPDRRNRRTSTALSISHPSSGTVCNEELAQDLAEDRREDFHQRCGAESRPKGRAGVSQRRHLPAGKTTFFSRKKRRPRCASSISSCR